MTKARRERVQAGLLHRNASRRSDTIQSVPQHLHERFGDLRGVMIDDRGARHVTVAGAAVLSSGQFRSIFMADTCAIALLFHEIGHPTLCLA